MTPVTLGKKLQRESLEAETGVPLGQVHKTGGVQKGFGRHCDHCRCQQGSNRRI